MLVIYTSQNARSGGQELALTLEQHELLRALGVWPVDREGRAYASAWLVPCEPGRKPTMGTKDLLRYLASAEGGAR